MTFIRLFGVISTSGISLTTVVVVDLSWRASWSSLCIWGDVVREEWLPDELNWTEGRNAEWLSMRRVCYFAFPSSSEEVGVDL